MLSYYIIMGFLCQPHTGIREFRIEMIFQKQINHLLDMKNDLRVPIHGWLDLGSSLGSSLQNGENAFSE